MRKILVLIVVSLASLSLHAGGITVPTTGLSRNDGNILLKQIVDAHTAAAQDFASQRQKVKADHDSERARLIDAIRACAGDATCAANQETALKDLERTYANKDSNLSTLAYNEGSDAMENAAKVVVAVFFEDINLRLQAAAQTKQIDIVSAPVLNWSGTVDCKMQICWANSGVGTAQIHLVFLDNATQKVVDIGFLLAAGSDPAEYYPTVLSDAKNDGTHILGLSIADVDSLIQRLRTKSAVGAGVGMTYGVNGGGDLKSDVGVIVGSQAFY